VANDDHVRVRYQDKKIRWLIKLLIMAGEVGALGEATGEGKSQIASHLASVVTARKEFAADYAPKNIRARKDHLFCR